MKIDSKSLTIGLLLGVLVMFGRGAGGVSQGRYSISAVQRADESGQPQTVVFVLDNSTNKVYGYVKSEKGWQHPETRSFVIKDGDME